MADNIEARLNATERDLAGLVKTVASLSQSVQDGFEQLRLSQTQTHQELQRDLKDISAEVSKKTDNIGKPNYNAIGVAATLLIAAMGWYVSSVVGPLREEINAAEIARVSADNRSQQERDRLTEQLHIVSKDVERLRAWDDARKLWNP